LAELKEPQFPEPQVTDQLTPADELSFPTTALRDTLPFTAREDGGVDTKATVIGTPVIVKVTLEYLE
jgi:hypothetical protein